MFKILGYLIHIEVAQTAMIWELKSVHCPPSYLGGGAERLSPPLPGEDGRGVLEGLGTLVSHMVYF